MTDVPAAGPAALQGLTDASTPESRVSRPRATLVVLVAGIGLVVAGQMAFTGGRSSSTGMALWLSGLVLATVALRAATSDAPTSPDMELAAVDRRVAPRTGWRSLRTVIPAAVSLSCCVMLWSVEQSRPPDEYRWDLVVVWVLGISCAFGAVWQPAPGHFAPVLRAWWERRRGEVVILAGLAIVGALATLVRLASHPWTFNGDEGGFALLTVDILDNEPIDPFGVGYLGHPTLYNAMQAAAMTVFGRGVFAARFVIAVLGAFAVPLAYLVTKRLVGNRRAGFIAAALLCTFHIHLFWSRNAIPNGAAAFFVLLVLYLADRCLTHGGPAAPVAAGLTVGLAQYFYFSNRVLVGVVVVAFAASAISAARHGATIGRCVRSFCGRLGLAAVAFFAATAPLLSFYDRYPGQLNSRVAQVSIFSNGWLRAEAALTGRSNAGVIWDHLVTSAMLPFRTAPQGFYRGSVPFVGWPLAVASAVGLALVTSRCLRPRWIGLGAAYWASVVGMALTTGPADTNRWVMAVPLVCVFAAVGLDSTATALVRLVPAVRGDPARRANRADRTDRTHSGSRGDRAVPVVVSVATAAFVAVAASTSMWRFVRDDNQVEVYSDLNTQVAEHVARDVLSIDPSATVYFSGAPRMRYGGFANLLFRTPDVRSIDVDEPWVATDDPPPLDGTTVFVVLPERSGELAPLRAWFPSGREQSRRDEDGTVLYAMLIVDGR